MGLSGVFASARIFWKNCIDAACPTACLGSALTTTALHPFLPNSRLQRSFRYGLHAEFSKLANMHYLSEDDELEVTVVGDKEESAKLRDHLSGIG
jgi:hypothetical protein